MSQRTTKALWALELWRKDGELVFRAEKMRRRDLVHRIAQALAGKLPPAEYPWQLELRVRFEGDSPAGLEHPDKVDPDRWVKALAEGMTRVQRPELTFPAGMTFTKAPAEGK